jgi:hypothetical protein
VRVRHRNSQMATIINFPAAAEGRKEKAERPEGPAQILFFTGVRYERFDVKEMRKPVINPDLPLAL